MANWPEYPLETFVDPERAICYGIVQPGEKCEDGVPIVRVNNFKYGRIFTDDALRVSAEVEKKYSRSRLKGGELLITLVGTMGLSAIAPDELCGWNVARAVGIVPLKATVDKRWINFIIRSEVSQQFIRMHANTTVQSTFNLRDLANLPILMPPEEVRVPASELLSALDDKIDLNRRMNETLEAMARALFKDWFVDFGPTRAKMEGREPYLTPDLWALFPDRLDGDGRPEEWGTKPLDEIADFLNGLALQKFPPEGNDSLPVIKIAQLRSGNADNADRASRNVPDQYVVQDGDVIFSWSGSLMQRVWTSGPGALNQHLFKVTSDAYPKWFYYFWIDHYMPRFQAIAASKATTMGHIQRRHLTEAITCVGVRAVITAADHLIGPLFARMIENDLESRTLARTRDLLLPKLMSGEISLQGAETAAGKAL